MLEWGILVCILLVVFGIFGLRVRWVQGMAERATVVSMLGAMRTALVVGYVKNGPLLDRRNPNPNPFLWFEKLPAQYGGEGRMGQSDTMTPGQWAFDPVCVCVRSSRNGWNSRQPPKRSGFASRQQAPGFCKSPRWSITSGKGRWCGEALLLLPKLRTVRFGARIGGFFVTTCFECPVPLAFVFS